nr:MAG TPA: hypothetical protein [Caudoviricetes sp.]
MRCLCSFTANPANQKPPKGGFFMPKITHPTEYFYLILYIPPHTFPKYSGTFH